MTALNPEKALPYFERAVVLNPDIPDGYLNLGNTYALIGDYEQTITSYKKAHLFNPNSLNPLVNLGRVYSYLGRIEEARAVLNEALELAPGSEIAKQLLNELPNL